MPWPENTQTLASVGLGSMCFLPINVRLTPAPVGRVDIMFMRIQFSGP